MIKRMVTIVIIGAMLLGVIMASVSWVGMTTAERAAVGQGVMRGLVWMGIVGILPWATWFLTTWAVRRDSNRAAALLVIMYVVIDALILLWMFSLVGLSATGTSLVVLGLLMAVAYNVLVCDWIAEQISA
jgi:hypothetical protein